MDNLISTFSRVPGPRWGRRRPARWKLNPPGSSNNDLDRRPKPLMMRYQRLDRIGTALTSFHALSFVASALARAAYALVDEPVLVRGRRSGYARGGRRPRCRSWLFRLRYHRLPDEFHLLLLPWFGPAPALTFMLAASVVSDFCSCRRNASWRRIAWHRSLS